MKNNIAILSILMIVAGAVFLPYSFAAVMSDYCQVPPFVNAGVAPNLLFVVDASGSMSYKAYSYGDSDSNSDGMLDDYNPNLIYEGYFNPAKHYQQDTNGIWTEVTGTGACTPSCARWTCRNNNSGGCVLNGGGCRNYGCCSRYVNVGPGCPQNSGNYLNYANMNRIDLLRWAMTGGSPSSCSTNDPNYCDPELWSQTGNSTKVGSVCNNSITIDTGGTVTGGCILEDDDGSLIRVPWGRVYEGLAFNFESLALRPRMGVMLFSGASVRSTGQVYPGDYTSTDNANATYPYTHVIASINSAAPSGTTPTGPAMNDAMNYFKQVSPLYGGLAVQSGTNYQWRDPMYVCDNAKANCKLVPCAKNFVMLLSDGQWNTPSCNTSADPVVPAYLMHEGFTNAQTSVATTVNSVYTIGLFMGGTGEQAMKNIAMYGSYDLAHGTWPANLAGYPTNSCSMDDCGSGAGSGCTPLPSSSTDWDYDGNNTPDTFYKTADALEIKDAIINSVMDTLRRVSSGTAVSILSSSEGSGANLLQAVFYPKKVYDNLKEISWTSEMQDVWYYLDPYLRNPSIREDTVQDHILNLSNDRIAEFFYDTTEQRARVHLWNDAGNGSRDTSSLTTVDFEQLKSLWQAGKLLWQRDYADRTIYTSITGSTLIPFSGASAATLQSYLQAPSSTESGYIINYIRGLDRNDVSQPPLYRDRTVAINGSSEKVWKLGDIISSTPRIAAATPLDNYHLDSPAGYADSTYALFEGSQNYKGRGMVYVGANDGMLHAFNLGLLKEKWTGQGQSEKAQLTGSNMGAEQWAFIPKNVLPYLTYLTDPNYNHLFYVNLSPVLNDVSITIPTYQSSDLSTLCVPATATCTSGLYYDCPKQTCINRSSQNLVSSSWETVLVGGMGFGGASKNPGDACSSVTECVKAPMWDPADATKALGLSSYFALKITDQNNPVLLWEFSHPELGYSSPGPAFMRVGSKYNNGRWFVVLASGPTGPLSGNQFLGTSNQNLKLFILDLKTGTLLRTIDTGIARAFAGSLTNAGSDPDRWNPSAPGNNQDDVLYFGYTKKDTATGTWTKGGVLRLVTNESTDPNSWSLSTVIDNIGPVTSGIAKLQDRTALNNGKFWLYFGTGRYFYKVGTNIDDADGLRSLYGVKEPCYDSVFNKLNPACTTSVSESSLVNQTTTIGGVGDTATGWKIGLEASSTTYKAERVISDPVAATSGAVFFITYEPSTDVCALEGRSFIWGVKYNTGGQLSSSSLIGEVLVQSTTGSIEERRLADTFGSGRRSGSFAGGAPGPASVASPPNAVKKFMHIKER